MDKKGNIDDQIIIPAQFDKPTDVGYLAVHEKLTKELLRRVKRPDAKENVGYVDQEMEKKKDGLFEQVCEDTAREILLNPDHIKSVLVARITKKIVGDYKAYLANPAMAEGSRGSAIH